MLSSLGLSSEAHKALVAGTHMHSHSHTLWLLRLKWEVGGGDVGSEEGEGEGGRKEGEDTSQSLTELLELCSEAVDNVPKEVGHNTYTHTHTHTPYPSLSALSKSVAVLAGATHNSQLLTL